MSRWAASLPLAAVVVATTVVAAPAYADDCTSNVMIVLDRSCSMQDPPQKGGAQSKWQLAGLALQKLTTDYAGKLNFGLIMFPDQTGQSCLQDGPIYVNVAPGQEAQVVSTVMSTMPNGPCVTDIGPAITQVSTDPQFAMPYTGVGSRSFVLFISDGEQTCGGSDAQITSAVAALYNNGYDSYIVGFGGDVSPTSLDMFAAAGGVPRGGGDAGGHLYYQADNAADLDTALAEIAGAVTGSEFGCPGPPCPDGRCFAADQMCVNGSCVPDTVGGPDASANVDDGGTSRGQPHGCNCQLGGPASTGGAAPFAILLALMLLRRRRA
ncbi:MAG TPA: vWA domain-containing protein [Polyangia bacterium]|jgi:MYXO-CTERM domain-containing protein